MGFHFPSQEWANHFMEEINSSEAYANAAKSWEGDFEFVVEGEPPQTLYVDLWHGKCREVTYISDANERVPEFTIRANMEKWKKVVTGKQDPVQALITRSLQLEGNLVKIMKNVKAAQELVRCATRVDTEFDI